MEPASSNPPTEPVSPQTQEPPAVVPTSPVSTPPVMPPVEPVPVAAPTPPKPGSSKVLVIVAIAALVLAVLAALAYFLGYLSLGQKSQTTEEAMPIVPATEAPIATTSSSPVASPSGQVEGKVTGKLCYPAEMAPAGDIVAKDTTSGKTYTQAFVGTAAGGTLAYTFPLAVGTYHLKYQTAPTMAGYFTACAKDPTNAVCSQDANHVHLDVVVSADKTTASVDLCDFYWNQTQKAALDASF